MPLNTKSKIAHQRYRVSAARMALLETRQDFPRLDTALHARKVARAYSDVAASLYTLATLLEQK